MSERIAYTWSGDILTVEDLKNELKIGRVQAYNLAHAIPHIRVGKSIRIRRAALEQWQAEQEGMKR